jgi:AraC-like DNA-binding protein
VRLARGDIVMFPRGDALVISSAPGLRAPEDRSDWRYVTRNDPKPIAVAYHRGVLRPGLPGPADEARSVVVCGFVACDMKPFNPLINALPPQLHLRAGDLGPWTVQLLDQAVTESRERRAGSAAVLERASEFDFVDAARRYLDALPPGSASWLGALRDRYVGQAIVLLHERPAEPWSVDELGRQVGLSRSALHERYVELTGQAPMQYLAHWRVQLGAGLLRQGRAKVAAIAQEVGYDSEAAFARAFKPRRRLDGGDRQVVQRPGVGHPQQALVHPTAGRDGLESVADRNAVAQHRRIGGQIDQRHLVALRHRVAQRQPRGQQRACSQAAVVGHDGDVVALVHADGQRFDGSRHPRRCGQRWINHS